MRAYAYGGNQWCNRLWLGEWSNLPSEEVWLDTTGLRGDQWVIGFILVDQQPCLLIRHLQQYGERSYPYSLLLDPGLAIWGKFDWNAAELALALVGQPNAPGYQLLLQPENWDLQKLQLMLESLPARESHVVGIVHSPPSLFAQRWAGAMCSEEQLLCQPEELGLPELVSLESLSRLLFELPACWRTGWGWLCGGSLANAEALQVRVGLVPTSAPIATDRLSVLQAQGQQILQSWQTVKGDSRFSYVVRRRENIPLWRWPENDQNSPRSFLERLFLLAELLQAQPLASARLLEINRIIERSGTLATELREALRMAASGGTDFIDETSTSLLLEDHFVRGLLIEKSWQHRLHPETVQAELIKRRITPIESPIEIPGARRFLLWQGLLETSEAASQITLAETAVKDLQNHLRGDTAQEKIIELVDNTLRQTDHRLLQWSSFLNAQPGLWQGLAPMLQARALEHARQQSPDWPQEYLVFAQDPGGHRLADCQLPIHRLEQLVQTLHQESQQPGERQTSAQTWLEALAQSPLRTQIPIKSKLELARAGVQGWQRLEAVRKFLERERNGFPELLSATAAELRFLLPEMEELFRPLRPQPMANLHPLQQAAPFAPVSWWRRWWNRIS